MLFHILLFLSFPASSQTISFSFTGENKTNNTSMKIDSVYIYNETNNSDTLIIGDNFSTFITSSTINKLMDLDQSGIYPNPFKKEFKLSFQSAFHESARIQLYNMNGRKIAEWNNFIVAGINTFKIKSGNKGLLILRVASENFNYNAKIICTEKNRDSEIILLNGLINNHSPVRFKSFRNINEEFIYTLGDNLRFIGYSYGISSEEINDKPLGNKNYNFFFDVSDYIPTADFFSENVSIAEGVEINFIDMSTNSPTFWEWDFGDGNTSYKQNPSHEYALAGTYSVQLIVKNQFGTDTLMKQNYIIVNPRPKAAFSADITTISEGGEVNFTDESINSPDTWMWDFGDGNTSNIQNPNHVYNSAGVFSVTLVVTNNFGSDTITIKDYINVINVLEPLLNVSADRLDFDTVSTEKFIDIKNIGAGNLIWSVSESIEWLTVNILSGTTTTETDQIIVTVNRNGIEPGNHSGTISITSNGGNFDINVTMEVKELEQPETPVKPGWK